MAMMSLCKEKQTVNIDADKKVDMHILVVPKSQWRSELRNTYLSTCTKSVSAGFVRVFPDITLVNLKEEMSKQLDGNSLPDSYIFLRNIGHRLTWVSPKQESVLKVRLFLPPIAPCPEIYILDSKCFQNEQEVRPPVENEQYKQFSITECCKCRNGFYQGAYQVSNLPWHSCHFCSHPQLVPHWGTYGEHHYHDSSHPYPYFSQHQTDHTRDTYSSHTNVQQPRRSTSADEDSPTLGVDNRNKSLTNSRLPGKSHTRSTMKTYPQHREYAQHSSGMATGGHYSNGYSKTTRTSYAGGYSDLLSLKRLDNDGYAQQMVEDGSDIYPYNYTQPVNGYRNMQHNQTRQLSATNQPTSSQSPYTIGGTLKDSGMFGRNLQQLTGQRSYTDSRQNGNNSNDFDSMAATRNNSVMLSTALSHYGTRGFQAPSATPVPSDAVTSTATNTRNYSGEASNQLERTNQHPSKPTKSGNSTTYSNTTKESSYHAASKAPGRQYNGSLTSSSDETDYGDESENGSPIKSSSVKPNMKVTQSKETQQPPQQVEQSHQQNIAIETEAVHKPKTETQQPPHQAEQSHPIKATDSGINGAPLSQQNTKQEKTNISNQKVVTFRGERPKLVRQTIIDSPSKLGIPTRRKDRELKNNYPPTIKPPKVSVSQNITDHPSKKDSRKIFSKEKKPMGVNSNVGNVNSKNDDHSTVSLPFQRNENGALLLKEQQDDDVAKVETGSDSKLRPTTADANGLLGEIRRLREESVELGALKAELSSALRSIQMLARTHRERNDNEWKRKYFQEKKTTVSLEDKIYKRRSNCQRLENTLDKCQAKQAGAIQKSYHPHVDPPSESSNVKIQCRRYQSDIVNLKSRLDTVRKRLSAERKAHKATVDECKIIQGELRQKKISHSRQTKQHVEVAN